VFSPHSRRLLHLSNTLSLSLSYSPDTATITSVRGFRFSPSSDTRAATTTTVDERRRRPAPSICCCALKRGASPIEYYYYFSRARDPGRSIPRRQPRDYAAAHSRVSGLRRVTPTECSASLSFSVRPAYNIIITLLSMPVSTIPYYYYILLYAPTFGIVVVVLCTVHVIVNVMVINYSSPVVIIIIISFTLLFYLRPQCWGGGRRICRDSIVRAVSAHRVHKTRGCCRYFCTLSASSAFLDRRFFVFPRNIAIIAVQKHHCV